MLDWEEYRRWMSQAEATLRLIDADIEYEGYSWACFKAQQAAELALKALLKLAGRPAFGRDLLRLLREASEVCEEDAGEELEACTTSLDKMYIPPRYPDAFPEGAPWEHYTMAEAANAKRCATLIIDWVKRCAEKLESTRGEEEGKASSS